MAEPTKQQFYKRFVDNIINNNMKTDQIISFKYSTVTIQILTSNHPKIKYTTTEVNPDKFLDTKVTHNNGIVTTIIGKIENYQYIVHLESQNVLKETN